MTGSPGRTADSKHPVVKKAAEFLFAEFVSLPSDVAIFRRLLPQQVALVFALIETYRNEFSTIPHCGVFPRLGSDGEEKASF